MMIFYFFFSSRRRHTRYWRDWSSDVCSSDLDRRVFEDVVDLTDAGVELDQLFLDILVLAVIGDIAIGAQLLDALQQLRTLDAAQQVALALQLCLPGGGQQDALFGCHIELTLCRPVSVGRLLEMRQSGRWRGRSSGRDWT